MQNYVVRIDAPLCGGSNRCTDPRTALPYFPNQRLSGHVTSGGVHGIIQMHVINMISSMRVVKKGDYSKTFQNSPRHFTNVFNPSRVSPSNHFSSVSDGHSIPDPAIPSAGWSHPLQFSYMRRCQAPTLPHGNA